MSERIGIRQLIDLFSLRGPYAHLPRSVPRRQRPPRSAPRAHRGRSRYERTSKPSTSNDNIAISDRMMQQPKVSAVFLAFIEPVFLTPGGPPPTMYREIFKIAVMVWNAVMLDDHQGTDFLADLRSRIQLFDDPNSRTLFGALVEDLIDRRRSAFAEHQWLVGDWEIFYRPNGEPRVRVEARVLTGRS